MNGHGNSASGRTENGRPGRPFFHVWFLLCRPWSLAATVVPALIAAALGGTQFIASGASLGGTQFIASAGASAFSWTRWALALAAAVPLQIACNLLNTWGDDRSGVDAAEGAFVSTPQLRDGLVTSRQVLFAAIGCLALTAALGAPLLFFRAADAMNCVPPLDALVASAASSGGTQFIASHASLLPNGWAFNLPLAVIAAIGFAGATNYATGVRFKYRGLGVPFVFFLMGAIETAGFWAASVPGAPVPCARLLLLTLPVGCLVAVIMHGNDMRDISSDRAAGIRTVASMLGPRGALALYAVLHLLPYVGCLVLCFAFHPDGCHRVFHARPLLGFAVLPLTWRTLRTAVRVYRTAPAAPPWRGLERASGAIHLLFGLAYALVLA